MSDLDRYDYRAAGQEIVQFETPMEAQGGSVGDLVGPILRRWYVVLGTWIVVCGIGLPAIWFLMEDTFNTRGRVRISPVVSRILFNDSDSERPMPNYENFMNSEAGRMASPTVLNRVADDLKPKNLTLFADAPDLFGALRQAVADGVIVIVPERRTEFVNLAMTSRYPREAEQVIDSLIRCYMNVIRSEEDNSSDSTLNVLDEQKRTLEGRITLQMQEINRLLDEFGTGELDARQQMMLQTVARLQQDLITVTIQRIALEASMQMLTDGTAAPRPETDRLERQTAFLNADPTVQSLTQNIRQYENQIIIDRQMFNEKNPELQNKIAQVETFKSQLEAKRAELIKQFDARYEGQTESRRDYEMALAKAQLAQTQEHEKKLREELERYDSATMSMGRKQLNIDDKKAELERTRSVYNQICDRIAEIEVEQKRPARISIAEMASSVPAQSKKMKLMGAMVFGGFGMGGFFAFLLAKADKRLRDTHDVVKRVGVRIIGTTTSAKDIDKRMVGQQLSDDYQTIRANLGLVNGHPRSKVLVVTSPGMRDGKTTFSVNLALSFAQAGEKVLLIDGDLRKPDVTETLNLPRGLRGLQDLLFGKPLEASVYVVSPSGLHVLASDHRNANDALDLLGQAQTVECMKNIAEGYDHVIIDTPPVLAFSDALVWAKMADGVILTSFAEHTSRPDLREAIDRLEQIGIRVIGTVLNNVRVGQSYHRYGYGYGYGGNGEGQPKRRKRDKRLLLASGGGESKSG
ncbi:MAG: polysaccharide biosynthesis tyrosine autokinase [Phycisphaerae bacterium]|nr:polysaccharide biosynthesis tyrosine autokinase [Phycisphaerae bacterium]